MPKTFELILKGRVQGVGLRYNVQKYAKKVGLKGWIRNEPNGTVCLCLQNTESEIKSLINWLKKNIFSEINISKITLKNELINYDDFIIIY